MSRAGALSRWLPVVGWMAVIFILFPLACLLAYLWVRGDH